MEYYNRDLKYEDGLPAKIEKVEFGIHPDMRVLKAIPYIDYADGTATFIFISPEELEKLLKDSKKNYVHQLINIPILASKNDNRLSFFRVMKEVL